MTARGRLTGRAEIRLDDDGTGWPTRESCMSARSSLGSVPAGAVVSLILGGLQSVQLELLLAVREALDAGANIELVGDVATVDRVFRMVRNGYPFGVTA